MYSMKAITELKEVARIINFEVEAGQAPTCVKRPLLCPTGLQEASFVVDLQRVKPEDLTTDGYGLWGKSSSCRKMYFSSDNTEEGNPKMIPSGEADHQWQVQKLRWKHPASEKNGDKKFVRYSYRITAFREKKPRWGIISYQWLCEPFEIEPKAHGNAKKRPDEPYIRTDPSVLKDLKEERKHATAEQAYYNVKAKKGGAVGVRSSSELPRGRSQVYNLSRSSEYLKQKSGVKAHDAGYSEAEQLCIDQNFPFAWQWDSGITAKDGKQFFRCFLAEEFQLDLHFIYSSSVIVYCSFFSPLCHGYSFSNSNSSIVALLLYAVVL